MAASLLGTAKIDWIWGPLVQRWLTGHDQLRTSDSQSAVQRFNVNMTARSSDLDRGKEDKVLDLSVQRW